MTSFDPHWLDNCLAAQRETARAVRRSETIRRWRPVGEVLIAAAIGVLTAAAFFL